jgi:hypothetical protein
MDDVAEIRAEIASLTERLAALQARLDDGDEPAVHRSRRALLKVAAGTAIGAAALGSARPAAATNGQTMLTGQTYNTDRKSSLLYGAGANANGAALGANDVMLVVAASTQGALALGAIQGISTGSMAGIHGAASAPPGIGVLGASINGDAVSGQASGSGHGVSAHSSDGVGLSASGVIAMVIDGAGAPPTLGLGIDTEPGMITFDDNRDLWLCVAGGQPGTWQKLGGRFAAGAFHPIDPQRVYDSRFGDGAMTPNTSRTVSVADGLAGGTVFETGIVPAGSSAIAFNVTVSGPTGPNFLSVTPGGSTSYSTSTINFPGGFDCANGSIVRLGGDRQVTIFCGDQSGSTHVIIDVTGYYR